MKIWKGQNLIEKDPIYILGIESSCDDTSASIVRSDGTILSNVVLSHCDNMKDFGGVVPEFAARAHVDCIKTITQEAIKNAGLVLSDIDVIGFTRGPGLIGGLIVSTVFGKVLASVLRIPTISVNHLEGHIFSTLLEYDVEFPFLALIITGGHSQIVAVHGVGQYVTLGSTLDDAVGESFDKVARMLGLGYPGGRFVEEMAMRGRSKQITLPKPMIRDGSCNFSCSGLKTAVKVALGKLEGKPAEQEMRDICAAFQDSIAEILVTKLQNATHLFHTKTIAVVGGVAANQHIRQAIEHSFPQHTICIPSQKLCSDNAAMIAIAAYKKLQKGYYSNICATPDPALMLDDYDIE